MKVFSASSLFAGASLLAATSVMAQTAPAPAAPAAAQSSLAYNVGVVTDYRYRGISQSRSKPAVQGGLDYTDKSGFYVGAWASTIKWIKDSAVGASGSFELDIYGGYKASVGAIGYDVGVLRYEYVGNKGLAVNANTTEIYGAVTYGVFTAKYSHSLTDTFANADSKGSTYVDLSANFDLGGGFTLTPHIGRQVIKNAPGYSYTDYSMTLAKDLGNGLSATGMIVGTNADKVNYDFGGKGYLGKDALVVGIKYSF